MPRLIPTLWHGELHLAIEYGPARTRHLSERLGVQGRSMAITDEQAREGLNVLRGHFFPAPQPAEGDYYGA